MDAVFDLRQDLDRLWEQTVALLSLLEAQDGSCSLLAALGTKPPRLYFGPGFAALTGWTPEALQALGAGAWRAACVPEHAEALERWRSDLPLTWTSPELSGLRFLVSFTAQGPGGERRRLHYEARYLIAPAEGPQPPAPPRPWAKWVSLRPDPAPLDAPFAGVVIRAADGQPLPGWSAPAPARETPLSPREREILEYCALGYASADTARLLGLSHHTVNNHRRAILAKLGASNIAEAVRLAL